MKELSRENRLDENVIYSIMKEEKAKSERKIIRLKWKILMNIFQKTITPREKSESYIETFKRMGKKKK